MGLKNVTTSNGKGTASNGTTAVTIYTAPASLKDIGQNTSPGYGAWVERIRIYNADTVAQEVQLHNIPNGGALGNDTMFERITIPTLRSYVWEGKEWLASQDIIQIKLGAAHTANPVYSRPQVVEST